MPNLRKDTDGAASTVIAFLMAGIIFVGSVGALLVVSRDAGTPEQAGPATTAGLSVQAQGLADLLVDSPGYSSSVAQGGDWTSGTTADDVVRLGLKDPSTQMMDYDKFQNLRLASFSANPTNGRVDYEEARVSLGLSDTDLDFHVRSFPSLQSIRDLLDCKDPVDPTSNPCRDRNLKVAYIGDSEPRSDDEDVDPAAGLVVDPATCAVRADGQAYRISNQVTNGGTTTVQFIGLYKVDLNPSAVDVYEDRARSYMVPAGGSTTLTLDVPYKAGRTCNAGANAVTLDVRDINVLLGDTRQFALTGPAATSPVTRDLVVSSVAANYDKGQAVAIEFDGELPKKGSDPSATLSLTVMKADGTVVHGPETLTVDHKKRSHSVAASKFNADATTDFVVELTYVKYGTTSIGTLVRDNILVLPAGTDPAAYAPPAATVTHEYMESTPIEVGFLDELVNKFCPYYYSSDTESPMPATYQGDDYDSRCGFKASEPALSPDQPGDVFLDVGSQLLALNKRLIDPSAADQGLCPGNVHGAPRYDLVDVLVVGSNIDHSEMNKAKSEICEWVFGGGTLIVFGTETNNNHWMQPIFNTKEASGSGALSTPDMSHPILTQPDQLAYDSYEDWGNVWNFNGQVGLAQDDEDDTNDYFTQVVEVGGDPTLAVSDPGAFGAGNLIMATWKPYDIFGSGPHSGTSDYEGRTLINNMLMLSYRDLFLDYGPEIPSGARQATAAQRVVEIVHPEFDEPITMTLFVYVF